MLEQVKLDQLDKTVKLGKTSLTKENYVKWVKLHKTVELVTNARVGKTRLTR